MTEESGVSATSGRPAMLVVAAVIALALAAVFVFTRLGGNDPDDAASQPVSSPSASQTPTSSETASPKPTTSTPTSPEPEPSPSPTGAPPEHETVEEDLSTTLDNVSEGLTQPQAEISIDGTAGAFEEMIALQLQEYSDQGWTQEGSPEVVSVEIIEELPDGALLVNACIDSTDIKVLDDRGRDMRGPGTPDRSMNTFTLIPGDGVWLVADQTFPEDPTC